jgi:D-tagatose-bisphosphate aldolase class II non-catalytic subunit
MSDCFADLRAARSRGEPRGLYSVCSGNALVVEAAVRRAAKSGKALLVEATANQVNQEGGYTGMKPADFSARLRALCSSCRADPDLVVFGGDHLGPYPWRNLPAEEAMCRAEELVRLFVRAGARKIHLDASMVLRGDAEAGRAIHDGQALDPRVGAERTARLCLASEKAFSEGDPARVLPGAIPPVYVIGTEVPVPGGAQARRNLESAAAGEGPKPTTPEDFRSEVELNREAFAARGLASAWDRVLAIVVQPGVEFDSRRVYVYDRGSASTLIAARGEYPGLFFEGHSTDFQPDAALAALVEDGVCVLKVGPALTFALREALFGLDEIAGELGLRHGAGLADTVERAMRDDPASWEGYYSADSSLAFSLKYAYSDRIRYYWERPEVSVALDRLFESLRGREIPPQLLSQYLPRFGSVHGGEPLSLGPKEIAVAAVDAELGRYEAACYPARA